MKKNYFITLEGIEGAGKSTTITLLAEYLTNSGIPFVLTREPGGTEISEVIRKIILDHYDEKMHPDTEMLLYFAGRAQHLNQVIIPALEGGKWVICDRFTDATYAYQGGGRGLPQQKISVLENWVQGGLRPDYTFLFDLDVNIGLKRIENNHDLDRIEKEKVEFFEKVRACYLERAKMEPNRFEIIDAAKSPIEVFLQLEKFLKQIL